MKTRHRLAFLSLLTGIAAVAYGATTYTTNYNLGKPGDGDANYGAVIRADLDTIDSQMKTNADSVSNHTADTVGAHAATAISTDGGVNLCGSSTTVEAYLDCLDGVFDPGSSNVVLLTGAQTITGVKTFAASPVFAASLSGILNTNGSGVLQTPINDSSELAAVISDETGTGSLVFATSPTFVTPDLGTPSAAVLTNATGLPVTTGVSGLGAGVATFLGTPSSANLASAVTDETGTGAAVFATSPTLITPDLGTPSAAVLTNATGLPVSTGVSGLGAGVATFLGTPSSANLAAAVTDETGTGAAVFATSPAFVTPNLGTPSAATLTNATGLPISTGVAGLGAGVATFLGTPSSANLASAITDETGTGAAVFGTSPTIATATITTPVITGGTIDNTLIGGTLRGTGNFTTIDANTNIEGLVVGYDGAGGNGFFYLTEQSSSPSTPGSGIMRLYPKSDNKLYTKDDTGLETQVGAGGTGELSVVDNPDDANAGWTASGAGITVETTTTAGDLPLGGVKDTAIKITPVSGTDYVYYRWTQPRSLEQRKLKVQWEQRPSASYASGDLKLEVYKHSDTGTCTYSGGSYTEFALSTDSSGTTSIPALHGRFTSTFDADDADCYELRVVRVAGVDALNLANVIVGPGIQPQGAAVTEWQSYTPTGSWLTNVTYTGKWRRIGDTMELSIKVATSGATTVTNLTVNMPSGYTIDTGKMASAGSTSDKGIGIATWYDSGGLSELLGFVDVQSTTSFGVTRPYIPTLYIDNSLSGGASTPFTFGAGDAVYMHATVPVAEWSGSGTVNIAQNDVEYAWNSSTSTTTSDTTSFAFGPSGAQIQNITASLTRRIRWATPVQASDEFVVEVSSDRDKWVPVTSIVAPANTQSISPYSTQNTNSYGIGQLAFVSSTDMEVYFGTYAYISGATYGAAGTAWSAGAGSYYWRVKKMARGQAVGFGLATATTSGLVNNQESGTFSATFTQSGGYSQVVSVRYRRVNNIVTLQIPHFQATATAAAGIDTAVSVVPASIRPTVTTVQIPCSVYNNGAQADVLGYLGINSDGSLNLRRSPTVGAFTIAAGAGLGTGTGTVYATFTYLLDG